MKYKIWCDELGVSEENAHLIEKPIADLAVENWARKIDVDNDDIILTGGVYTVMCRDESGTVTPYTVWGETVMSYYVEPLITEVHEA